MTRTYKLEHFEYVATVDIDLTQAALDWLPNFDPKAPNAIANAGDAIGAITQRSTDDCKITWLVEGTTLTMTFQSRDELAIESLVEAWGSDSPVIKIVTKS